MCESVGGARRGRGEVSILPQCDCGLLKVATTIYLLGIDVFSAAPNIIANSLKLCYKFV